MILWGIRGSYGEQKSWDWCGRGRSSKWWGEVIEIMRVEKNIVGSTKEERKRSGKKVRKFF